MKSRTFKVHLPTQVHVPTFFSRLDTILWSWNWFEIKTDIDRQNRIYTLASNLTNILFKTRNAFSFFFFFFFCCFISRIKRCMALYFNTIPDPMQHATSHSSLPTTTSKILLWPSMSKDLNPNKHTWNELERRVRGRVNAPANVRDLFQALPQEWVAIPEQVIDNWFSPCLRERRCWILRRTYPLLLCVSLNRKIQSDWTFPCTRRE